MRSIGRFLRGWVILDQRCISSPLIYPDPTLIAIDGRPGEVIPRLAGDQDVAGVEGLFNLRTTDVPVPNSSSIRCTIVVSLTNAVNHVIKH